MEQKELKVNKLSGYNHLKLLRVNRTVTKKVWYDCGRIFIPEGLMKKSGQDNTKKIIDLPKKG